ncbi:MAG: hypothetical protein IJV90_01765 [Candidatus Methanomethylophilaceae archaeon]|nr:hypothetical protein [Candidatus Methanomethylophilaceae archaeon]
MQTYLLEKTDNSVTIGFKDANLTLITPLMRALNDDDNVELVRYVDKHPELMDKTLYIQVKSRDAVAALQKASETVADYFSGIKA